MYRVALVVDPEDSQSFSSAPLAVSGLKKAESEYNVFYQVIDIVKDPQYMKSLRVLAEKNFDLILGVGPRATDAVCLLSPQYPSIAFTIVEGDCDSSSSIKRTIFDHKSLGELLTKFVQIGSGQKGRVAWVEQQSSPVWNEIQNLVKKTYPNLEVYSLDKDQLIPLASKLSGSRYGAVIVLAGDRLQKGWARAWTGKAAVLYSGPGANGSMRLIKNVDEVVYSEISKVVRGEKQKSLVTYGFDNGGLSLSASKGNTKQKTKYKEVFDLARRMSISKPILQN